MPNKVAWKKGMRLTSEIFNTMDAATEESLKLVSSLASAGRYGLFPTSNPFELSVNISNNILEIVSLNCHGITGNGLLVDIEFDSNFTHTFDNRVAIPVENDSEPQLLVVKILEGQRREINDMLYEPAYIFDLIGINTKIDGNCLPIGLVINQYGWRLDEVDFVPPCLFITAHPKFCRQAERALAIVKSVFDKCLAAAPDCVAKHLIAHIWQGASHAFCTIDKKRELLTPGELLALVQEFVNCFLIGCSIDEHVSLENTEPFAMFATKPYDARNLASDIETGLTLCGEIDLKMDAVCAMIEVSPPVKETPKPKPTPKPAPAPKPAPEPNRRKGWEGIII